MKYNYKEYEVRYPSKYPTDEGKYFGRTPILEQAVNAAKGINGCLYGITESGEKITIWY